MYVYACTCVCIRVYIFVCDSVNVLMYVIKSNLCPIKTSLAVNVALGASPSGQAKGKEAARAILSTKAVSVGCVEILRSYDVSHVEAYLVKGA